MSVRKTELVEDILAEFVLSNIASILDEKHLNKRQRTELQEDIENADTELAKDLIEVYAFSEGDVKASTTAFLKRIEKNTAESVERLVKLMKNQGKTGKAKAVRVPVKKQSRK